MKRSFVAQLRFPSAGRGGHDFYYNGKVTNRSNSFIEHRQQQNSFSGAYTVKRLEDTEQAAWLGPQRAVGPLERHSATGRGACCAQISPSAVGSNFPPIYRLNIYTMKRSKVPLVGKPIISRPYKGAYLWPGSASAAALIPRHNARANHCRHTPRHVWKHNSQSCVSRHYAPLDPTC